MTQRYDAATKTLWISSDIDGDSLYPNQDLRTILGYLQAKQLPDGRSVGAINVVFKNRDAAEYNESALSFSRIGTFVGTLDSPTQLAEGTSFSTHEDFGV